MVNEGAVRELLASILSWEAAHVGFARAVAGIPPELRGVVPEGLPHSAWELIEHVRIAQTDILAFCLDPDYVERAWPDEYWPRQTAPADEAEWDASVEAVERDTRALQALALDESRDLTASVPNGDGQSYVRELLLAADHTAYHVAQLVAVRRVLGCWEE